MAKNIIICSDGTGNTAKKGRGTNVFKLYESVDLNYTKTQLTFYDDGVGTESFKLFKILGGAFGFGLSRNVRQLYANLARVYEPNDNIYLFGFSRGAFTVRTLAGFISHCGVLNAKEHCKNDADLVNKVEGAYKAYRHRYHTLLLGIWRALFKWRTKRKYGFTTVKEFKKYVHKEKTGITPIHFIGVWDTVSAVGFPIMGVSNFLNTIYRFKFPDNKLGSNVHYAYHALSIDDKRRTFHPEMWDEQGDEENENQLIEQVWFAGVHSNVGGGYPKQGMSLVALHWMMEKAHLTGLHFNKSARDQYKELANVNDKLYDSRSGLAVYYRYAPRDISKICKNYHIKTPLIHNSVLQRSLNVTDGYAPGNLPKGCRFVSSEQEGFVNEYECSIFNKKMDGNKSLLNLVSSWIRMRMRLHAVFIALSAVFVYLMINKYSLSEVTNMVGDPTSVTAIESSAKVLLDAIWLLIPILLVVKLSSIARGKIQNEFSSFWYDLNKTLTPPGGIDIEEPSDAGTAPPKEPLSQK
ncbi:DUF2235 domain-containing protein [Kaarinaea lacus]